MPHNLRVDFPGARHHVYNRVKNRENALASPLARWLLRRHLGALPAEFDVRIHGYAFMSNHFHLMVESRSGRLPEAMQFAMSQVVRQLNTAHGWDGPLFRGRFANRIVESEAYWRHLLAYLHLNPVRAGIAPHAVASALTSHRAYLGLDSVEWLTTDELIRMFGGRDELARYVDDLAVGRREAPLGFDIDDLCHGAPSEIATARIDPRPWRDAIADVHRVTGREPRIDSDARDLAAWWAVRGGSTRRDIARRVRKSPQSVGQWVRRIERSHDPQIQEWRRELSLFL